MIRSIYITIFLPILILTTSCTESKPKVTFELLPSKKTSVSFSNRLPENAHMNHLVYQYYYTGGGVAIGDINNDGLQDLFFTGNIVDNRLYLNQGNLEFKDITETAGVKGRRDWCTGTTMADVNNDGYLDIYVCYSGRRKEQNRKNELYINQGDGTFTEEAHDYGLDDPGYGTQATFFDFDRDGDLDMYLLNHNIDPPTDTESITTLMETENKWVGDKLFENTSESGQVFFKDVSKQNNIDQTAIGFGLGVSVGDLNNDGWPDIYVSNDYDGHDFLYINQGSRDGIHQGFKDEMSISIPHTSVFSMGTDIVDINNDGWMDIMALDMASSNNFETKTNMSGMDIEKFNTTVEKGLHYQYMYNTLQLNNGVAPDSTLKFSDVAQISNLATTDWSWGPLIADYNNDGEKDIYIANGLRRNDRNNDYNRHIRETLKKTEHYSESKKLEVIQDLVANTPTLKKKNFLYRGNGSLGFENVTSQWGVEIPSYSNGASYADLDNDGDLEIVVNNVDDQVFIFRNNTMEINETSASFVKLKLVGPPQNPFGTGTKVSAKYSDKTLVQENYPTRGYISSVSPIMHFGLGKSHQIDELTILWPDGKEQIIHNLTPNRTIVLKYEDAENKLQKKDRKESSVFNHSIKSHGIAFTHIENYFDDYDHQILLPHRYSRFGPSLCVKDVNQDGLDDFFVGGAAGQSGALYLQDNNGNFKEKSGPWKTKEHAEQEDIASLFFDANSDGHPDLYVVSGGNEFVKGSDELQDRLYFNTGSGAFVDGSNRLPDTKFSGGTTKVNDFDQDGDLDIFVGERHIPHKYPMLGSGYIFENKNGQFKDITKEIAPGLSEIGLITDASWTDIDGDKDLDLIIVGEWMGVHIFYNDNNTFYRVEILPDSEGWWYSVKLADFDKDGDMDIVAGNLGLNYKYKASTEQPFEVFASDFDQDNKYDIVLGIHEGDALYPLRGRQCSSDQLSVVKKKFPTYESFGNATISDMLGTSKMKKSLNLKAKTFATTYFENIGDGFFKPSPLPNPAQFSSVNSIEVSDFDKDGNLDIVLAGNLFSSEVETPRNDASLGLFLKGNGKGEFNAYPPQKSGLYAQGDVKQTELIKIKGRNFMLIAPNNSELELVEILPH